MANQSRDLEFGLPAERLETEAVCKKLKATRYRLAKLADVRVSTACRWRKWIPKKHHEKLRPHLEAAK